jgi:hypothetical protein
MIWHNIIIKASKMRNWAQLPLILASISVLLYSQAVHPADATDCEVVARDLGKFGDFEITVDPTDPASNLLIVGNIGENLAGTPIIVAQLDGYTGKLLAGPTVIAEDFTGIKIINGPEFAFSEYQNLGVLYAGPYGVHAAWRFGGSWDEFHYDVWGNTFPGSPPPLPGTEPGRYPQGAPPFGVRTVAEFFGRFNNQCPGRCYGLLFDSVYTTLSTSLIPLGLEQGQSTLHPTADGYVIFSACELLSGACAVYEIAIDGSGGVLESTLQRLVEPDHRFRDMVDILATVHPSSKNIVVYGLSSDGFVILESSAAHVPLTLSRLFTDLPDEPIHMRITESPKALYLHFIDRRGLDQGSYVSRYRKSPQAPKFISLRGTGAELVFMSAASRLALFYKEKKNFVRCWVQ